MRDRDLMPPPAKPRAKGPPAESIAIPKLAVPPTGGSSTGASHPNEHPNEHPNTPASSVVKVEKGVSRKPPPTAAKSAPPVLADPVSEPGPESDQMDGVEEETIQKDDAMGLSEEVRDLALPNVATTQVPGPFPAQDGRFADGSEACSGPNPTSGENCF